MIPAASADGIVEVVFAFADCGLLIDDIFSAVAAASFPSCPDLDFVFAVIVASVSMMAQGEFSILHFSFPL